MENNKRCILIVDDEQKMVRALKDFFSAKGFYILEAYDGIEALDCLRDNISRIDIILLDMMMPRMDGMETLREIRKSSPLIPVIFLTAKAEEYDEINGLSNGADDYVAKPFSPLLLLARVETVLRRFGKDLQNNMTAGAITINASSRTVLIGDQLLDLTRREYDLLHYLMQNRSIPLTREQLLDAVWGYDFEGDHRTVDTHIRQLRSKLGDYAGYIKTVHCIGYQFEVDDENAHS